MVVSINVLIVLVLLVIAYVYNIGNIKNRLFRIRKPAIRQERISDILVGKYRWDEGDRSFDEVQIVRHADGTHMLRKIRGGTTTGYSGKIKPIGNNIYSLELADRTITFRKEGRKFTSVNFRPGKITFTKVSDNPMYGAAGIGGGR